MSDYSQLKKFAEFLGIRVTELPYVPKEDAAFIYSKDCPEIELRSKGKNKDAYWTLVLLHELGHAMDWLLMGKPHEDEIPKALEGAKKMSSANRRIVFEYERRAIKNMKTIYLLLDLKLPPWKLERERRYDLWIAEQFMKVGSYPTWVQRKAYRSEIRKALTKTSVSNSNLI